MAIDTDTAIDFTNRIIDLTGTTVYDASVLYSFCKEEFKLSPNIDDAFAWTANTPTDFTLKNKWILRRHSIRRLKNGSITANYGTDEIERIEVDGTPAVAESDIGRTVNDDTAGIGELVDFDNASDRNMIWVRTNGTVTNVVAASDIDFVGGTQDLTSVGASVNDTQDLWTNVTTIGDLAATGPQPLIYTIKGDLTDGDFNGNSRLMSGWEDDPDTTLTNADRGVLDVLVNIVDSGVTGGNPAGFVRLYGRQGLDKFADFEIDISPGGRISFPISQANDTEDTIGEYAIAIDGQSATDFTALEVVTGTNFTAEVVEYIEGVDNSTSILILRGSGGSVHFPTDNLALTGVTSGATGSVRGTAGGQLFTYDVETDPIVEGDYGTLLTSGGASAWQGTLRGHLTIAEGGATIGYAVCESNHDFNADGDFYATLANDEVVTGTGIDVTVDTTGGRYDRLCLDLDDVQIKLCAWDITVASTTGFVVGMNVTQSTVLAKGTILQILDATSLMVSQNNTIVFTGANTIDDDDGATTSASSAATRDETFQFTLSQQSAQTYWGLINFNGRTAAEGFHYIKYFQQADASLANSDPNAQNADPDYDRQLNMMKVQDDGASVLQTFEGLEFFRAFTDEQTPANNPVDQSADSRIAVKPGVSLTTGQGWALVNIAGADANNYVLTEIAGAKQSPLGTFTMTSTVTVSGDHVQWALDDGSGQEDKAQHTSGVGNALGDTDIVFNATLPLDTPTGSPDDIIVKMVDVSSTSPENKELRYRGASFATTTVTLVAGDTGTATATNANPLILEDTGAFPGTIIVGDVIRNTTDGSFGWVKEQIDANTILTTQLEGGGDNSWDSGDTWETNTLAVAYIDGTDTGYIPYIDRVANATSEAETLTFVTSRNVVIRIRNTAIDDFETTATVGSGGLTVGTVRNTDDKYTPT